MSVVGEIAALRSRGYDADFSVAPRGLLRCDSCGHASQVHTATEVIIESTARFEGASNPDDQAIVYGLRCTDCGVQGILVAAYGPTATAEEAAVVTGLLPRTSP